MLQQQYHFDKEFALSMQTPPVEKRANKCGQGELLEAWCLELGGGGSGGGSGGGRVVGRPILRHVMLVIQQPAFSLLACHASGGR